MLLETNWLSDEKSGFHLSRSMITKSKGWSIAELGTVIPCWTNKISFSMGFRHISMKFKKISIYLDHSNYFQSCTIFRGISSNVLHPWKWNSFSAALASVTAFKIFFASSSVIQQKSKCWIITVCSGKTKKEKARVWKWSLIGSRSCQWTAKAPQHIDVQISYI